MAAPVITIGIVVIACCAARTRSVPPRGHDEVYLELDQLGSEGGEPVLIPFRILSLEDDVLPFNPPQLMERLPEWRAL
jgi:hypothetical protein